MKQNDIDRIAASIAARIGDPEGAKLLGCGNASSSQSYQCSSSTYYCTSGYECGGAGRFYCPYFFSCTTSFDCDSAFDCGTSNFYCGNYN